MSQRDSTYERQPNDLYETPAWVTQALVPYIPPRITTIWEPACASGKMVRALEDNFYTVFGTDLPDDFTEQTTARVEAVITNPPFKLATQFIETALEVTKQKEGFVAMLLRTDFDHAKTRQHLFSGCPQFAKKLVLTKRIVWFDKPGAAPSFNHAWFVWDWRHVGHATLAWDIQ